MGCCGGSKGRAGGRSNPQTTTQTNPQIVPRAREIGSGELVEVEYTGGKRGAFGVRGKITRTRYKFSALAPRKFVDKRDIEAGLGAQFRIIPPEPPPPPPPPAPVVAKRVVPESSLIVPQTGLAVPPPPMPVGDPFDFSALKGVGPKTNELLQHGLGFHTLAELAEADAAKIASRLRMPGDNVARVKKWQEQAKELQGGSSPFV